MTDAPDSATPPSVILCVDDEPGILSALRRLFRAQGLQVHIAESGRQGLQILETTAIDLVISDMRMPEMDGVAFLEQVRQRQPDILRLLLTGYADIGSIMGAINRGEIYRYIAKPWDDQEIILTVRGALERVGLEREKKRLEAVILAHNEELQRLNASLEIKVSDRTAELRQANDALKSANERLKSNFLTSIKIFTALIELRDNKLAGHTRRVADLTRRLGLQLKLDNRQIQEVFVAGLLHAIGKVGFDDALLHTPRALMSARQAETYRQHPQRAEQLLMPLSELKATVTNIAEQLEHYDGSGYPRGVSAHHINLGARILAVAIAYESLRIGLWQAQPLSHPDALQYLAKYSGSLFDPTVVTALQSLQDLDKSEPAPDADQSSQRVYSHNLQPGMVLSTDLLAPRGTLLLTAGHVLDEAVIAKIVHFERTIATRLYAHVVRAPTAP